MESICPSWLHISARPATLLFSPMKLVGMFLIPDQPIPKQPVGKCNRFECIAPITIRPDTLPEALIVITRIPSDDNPDLIIVVGSTHQRDQLDLAAHMKGHGGRNPERIGFAPSEGLHNRTRWCIRPQNLRV